ncbi:hypothetical protein D9M72_339610 [compost metagenome]
MSGRQRAETAKRASRIFTVGDLADGLEVDVGDCQTLNVGAVLLPVFLAAIRARAATLDYVSCPVLVVCGLFDPASERHMQPFELILAAAIGFKSPDLLLQTFDLALTVLAGERTHAGCRHTALRSFAADHVDHTEPFRNRLLSVITVFDPGSGER